MIALIQSFELVLIGVFVVVIAIDIWEYGLKYPFIRHALYAVITILGLEFLFLVPFQPSLVQPLQDEITIVGLGLALVSIGYSIMIQLDSDYKQKQFEDKIFDEIKQIKQHLGINSTDSPAP